MTALLLCQCFQVAAAEMTQHNNTCQIASGTDSSSILNLDSMSDGRSLMMRGMTAKNFDPARYAGRWFEVASLKQGFAGQGQEDCHCTQVRDMPW